jgi:hypothetical protein
MVQFDAEELSGVDSLAGDEAGDLGHVQSVAVTTWFRRGVRWSPSQLYTFIVKYEQVRIELHPLLLKLVCAEAARNGETVSEWLASAAARALPEPLATEWRHAGLKALVEDFEAEFGEITEAERADVRAAWPD